MPKKITLAAQDRLANVEELAPRFFLEVLELDYAECLTTDESDLYDYADAFGDHRADVEAMLDRAESHYLIDLRAARSTRIVDLLELLKARGVAG